MEGKATLDRWKQFWLQADDPRCRQRNATKHRVQMRIHLDPLILDQGDYKITASDIVREVTEELTAEWVVTQVLK